MHQAANRSFKGLNKKVDVLWKRVDMMEGAITTLQVDICKLKEQPSRQYGDSPFVEEAIASHHTS